jgi:hypothetical protein
MPRGKNASTAQRTKQTKQSSVEDTSEHGNEAEEEQESSVEDTSEAEEEQEEEQQIELLLHVEIQFSICFCQHLTKTTTRGSSPREDEQVPLKKKKSRGVSQGGTSERNQRRLRQKGLPPLPAPDSVGEKGKVAKAGEAGKAGGHLTLSFIFRPAAPAQVPLIPPDFVDEDGEELEDMSDEGEKSEEHPINARFLDITHVDPVSLDEIIMNNLLFMGRWGPYAGGPPELGGALGRVEDKSGGFAASAVDSNEEEDISDEGDDDEGDEGDDDEGDEGDDDEGDEGDGSQSSTSDEDVEDTLPLPFARDIEKQMEVCHA